MLTLKDYVSYLSILTTVQFSLLLTEASPSKFPPLLTSFSFHTYTALSVQDKIRIIANLNPRPTHESLGMRLNQPQRGLIHVLPAGDDV